MKLLFFRSVILFLSIWDFCSCQVFPALHELWTWSHFPFSELTENIVKANSVTFCKFLISGVTGKIFCFSFPCLAAVSEAETENMVNAFVNILDNLLLEKSVCKSQLCCCDLGLNICMFCMYETRGYYLSYFWAWYKNRSVDSVRQEISSTKGRPLYHHSCTPL